MKIATSAWAGRKQDRITERYDDIIQQLGGFPDLLLLYCSAAVDVESIHARLRTIAPDVPLHGATSCKGVMTEMGQFTKDGEGIALLGVADPEGSGGLRRADPPDGRSPRGDLSSAERSE